MTKETTYLLSAWVILPNGQRWDWGVNIPFKTKAALNAEKARLRKARDRHGVTLTFTVIEKTEKVWRNQI